MDVNTDVCLQHAVLEYIQDTHLLYTLFVRLSPDATIEIQTASDVSEKKTASVVSEVVSEVLTVNSQSNPVQRGSPAPSESVRTAADSSAVNSPLSSVHTSPSAVRRGSPVSVQTAADSSAVDSELSSVHTSPSAAQRASPVRTAADSSAVDSSVSSVHTSPSLQHQQPTVKSQNQPSPDDRGPSLCDLCFVKSTGRVSKCD